MFFPKDIIIYMGEKHRQLTFSELRKKFIILAGGWISFVFIGTFILVGSEFYVENWAIENLKTEHALKSQELVQLKSEFNVLAKEYIEGEKISRIISSVNPGTDHTKLDFWVNSFQNNGEELFHSLNTDSKSRLELDATSYSLKTGVSLLLSVAALESDFRFNVRSNKDAYGPMQLMQITATHIGLNNRTDPEANLNGGVKYLISMLEKYKDHPDQVELALASYNAGATRVKRDWINTWGSDWGAIRQGLRSGGRFKETRDYVKSIVVLTQLFTSGDWSEMDTRFWSNYRRYLFQTDLAAIYEESFTELVAASESL